MFFTISSSESSESSFSEEEETSESGEDELSLGLRSRILLAPLIFVFHTMKIPNIKINPFEIENIIKVFVLLHLKKILIVWLTLTVILTLKSIPTPKMHTVTLSSVP